MQLMPFTAHRIKNELKIRLSDVSEISSLRIYSVDEMLFADINLLSEQSQLILSVHDLSGRLTNKMIIENPQIGRNLFSFKAEANGEWRPSKIYLVSIRGEGFIVRRKLVLR